MSIAATVRYFKAGRVVPVCVLCALFSMEPRLESPTNAQWLLTYLALASVALCFHVLSLRHIGNWFRLDVLFILGFSVVHFQWPVMYAISGISLEGMSNLPIDLPYVNYGTWLSAIGLVSWFLGYAFVNASRPAPAGHYQVRYNALLWVTAITGITFVLTAGEAYLRGDVYRGLAASGYGEGASVYLQLLVAVAMAVLTAVVLLQEGGASRRSLLTWLRLSDKRFLLLAASYAFLFLFIGDRGGAIRIMFVFLVLFGSVVRPIRFQGFAVLIVSGALLMTIIGLGRSADYEENIVVAGASKLEVSSGYDITVELANSLRTLYVSFAAVAGGRDFAYGKLWLSDLLAVVPFAQTVYVQLTGEQRKDISSSSLITYYTHGENPYMGEGTSLVGDVYLNFGVPGVMFCLFLLGMFFRRLTTELEIRRSYYWVIAASMMAADAFYMSRGGLLITFRPIIWGAVLALCFTSYRLRRGAAPAVAPPASRGLTSLPNLRSP